MGRMQNMRGRSRTVMVLLLVLTTLLGMEMGSAADCREEKRLGIQACKAVTLGQKPSPACCERARNEAAGVRGEERLLERDDSTTAAWWLVIATMTSRQIHGGSLRCYGRSCKGATRDSFVVALQRQICSRRWCDSGVCPVWYRSMGHYHGGSTRHHGSGDVGPDQRRCGDVDAAGATVHGDNGFVRCGSGRGCHCWLDDGVEMVTAAREVRRWTRCNGFGGLGRRERADCDGL
ncbi:hypothetical protein RJ640_000069 [Escallonia rubra]|uniref:Bifunctional inhibitor/plant lipid transfer protein/seed storage helical domain-containing protein n=1 Tax=Escallonia rubra TaxID=112253 RepID=A0AA88QUQ8_9ASTE|nr:hypothetical protein RJ640_000069 [Escallonia rubra]